MTILNFWPQRPRSWGSLRSKSKSSIVRIYLDILSCKISGPQLEKWPSYGHLNFTFCMYVRDVHTDVTTESRSKPDEVDLANNNVEAFLDIIQIFINPKEILKLEFLLYHKKYYNVMLHYFGLLHCHVMPWYTPMHQKVTVSFLFYVTYPYYGTCFITYVPCNEKLVHCRAMIYIAMQCCYNDMLCYTDIVCYITMICIISMLCMLCYTAML